MEDSAYVSHALLPLLAREQPDGCQLWTGSQINGYGAIRVDGEWVYAHRLIFEATKGPIPEDHELHHRCRVKLCVNGDHLVPLRHQEHIRLHKSYVFSCPSGHPYDDENTYVDPDGARRCRACARLRKRGKKWNQSPQSRFNRAVRQHGYWLKQLESETAEQREARLASYRDRYQRQVADPDKHARRLAGKRRRFQQQMATETPEQREARLAKRRKSPMT